MYRRATIIGVAAVLIASISAGCSTSHTPVGRKTVTVADLRASIVPEPNPAQVGLNTLYLTLTDSAGNPVPNANISATATTTLTGNTGSTESARSDGNGSYRVPIHTPVSELYIVTLTVQRTGKPDVTLKYGIKPV